MNNRKENRKLKELNEEIVLNDDERDCLENNLNNPPKPNQELKDLLNK